MNNLNACCKDIVLTALAPAIWGSGYIVTSQFLPDHPFTAALLRTLPARLLLVSGSVVMVQVSTRRVKIDGLPRIGGGEN